MTPKEKSRELVDKYFKLTDPYYNIEKAKQSALIAVEEIINDNPNIYDSDRLNYKYWDKVEQEINKL